MGKDFDYILKQAKEFFSPPDFDVDFSKAKFVDEAIEFKVGDLHEVTCDGEDVLGEIVYILDGVVIDKNLIASIFIVFSGETYHYTIEYYHEAICEEKYCKN